MYELAKKSREDMKSKARRLVSENKGDVDASGWREPTDMHGDVQTGERPVSKQGFAVDGKSDKPRADRVARKSGGGVWDNRNTKSANEDRAGIKHDGGFATGGEVPTTRFNFTGADSRLAKSAGLKTGGRAKKMIGGSLAYLSPALGLANMIRGKKDDDYTGKSSGGALDGGERPMGGRIARAAGGKAHWIKDAIGHKGALHKELGIPEDKKIPQKKLEKAAEAGGKEGKRARLAETLERMPHKSGGKVGKTNINIIIGGPKEPPPMQMAPPMPPPHPVPMPPPPGAGPPMAGPPPGMGAPPPGMMPRKRGGRAYPISDGAGGGKGRLEKIENYD